MRLVGRYVSKKYFLSKTQQFKVGLLQNQLLFVKGFNLKLNSLGRLEEIMDLI